MSHVQNVQNLLFVTEVWKLIDILCTLESNLKMKLSDFLAIVNVIHVVRSTETSDAEHGSNFTHQWS